MTIQSKFPRFWPISLVSGAVDKNSPEVGTETQVGDVKYRFIYNEGTTSIAVGNGCKIASGASGYTVTVSTASVIDLLVGVAVHASIPTANYGWVATQGKVTVLMETTVSVASGEGLRLGANGAFVSQSIATGSYLPAVGRPVASIASNGSGTAFIKAHI